MNPLQRHAEGQRDYAIAIIRRYHRELRKHDGIVEFGFDPIKQEGKSMSGKRFYRSCLECRKKVEVDEEVYNEHVFTCFECLNPPRRGEFRLWFSGPFVITDIMIGFAIIAALGLLYLIRSC